MASSKDVSGYPAVDESDSESVATTNSSEATDNSELSKATNDPQDDIDKPPPDAGSSSGAPSTATLPSTMVRLPEADEVFVKDDELDVLIANAKTSDDFKRIIALTSGEARFYVDTLRKYKRSLTRQRARR